VWSRAGCIIAVGPGALLLIGLKAITIEPLLALPRLTSMDRDREEKEIEEKLARCSQLAKEYVREPTAAPIRELEAELLIQLRRLEKQ
jgi:hypothetical protein